MTEVNEMINNLVKKANVALKEMSAFDQEKVDKIVDAMVQAGLEHSVELGNLAYSETGRGVAHDKAIKNVFAAGQVGESIKNHKTVGIIDENKEDKTITVAEPLGVLAGITPVTNPTSTTIFKSILSMKTRNAIVFSFHPQAMKSSAKAAEIVRDAAVAAGAPKDCIQWITEPSIEATNQLINNPGIASTLATGGPAMVKAAYSTGKPALGVGPGNGPLYIEKSADVDAAVKDVVASKTFDNGMICATENSLIIDNDIYEEIKQKLQASGVFFVKSADQAALAEAMFNPETGGVKGPIAGAKATKIAKMAGIEVPEDTKVLAAELDGIGHDYLLSGEKLSPVVSVYKANDQADAFDIATRLLEYGGLGHTAAIRTEDRDVAIKFGEEMQACRILVNTPCGLGGVGAINGLAPSLTLGTGTWGANSIDHNVNDYDLINRKVIAGCLKNDYLDSLIAKYAD
ncbi:acetaldehyde dehydrogenase (acetylating) [Apilactobacillus ozensis DSM 23829 = JCM 17196]|uniref:Acetaldehyde dehydrogenase (Acetylating) n=1 Tax=Apilactobacillus ozensis DSM 23829 = JCM 17196 TaxID=1423781 RepID=A0A0R2AUE2_9LACO|nr:acetaldehyde dehydrogenase (acetylating) [Apilactobacillus ozensis DSM 23829 = JCM 17196]